jgi:hypothetical protein
MDVYYVAVNNWALTLGLVLILGVMVAGPRASRA